MAPMRNVEFKLNKFNGKAISNDLPLCNLFHFLYLIEVREEESSVSFGSGIHVTILF